MTQSFNIRKADQVAAYFTLREGSKINVLKLIKLIYFAERRFLDKYAEVMIHDDFVSLPHGPVVSKTLNYLNDGAMAPSRNRVDAKPFAGFMNRRQGHDVSLRDSTVTSDDLEELSDADVEVMNEIWEELGHMDPWQLREYSHTPEYCPEWENPGTSNRPISYATVLRHLGKQNPQVLEEKILYDG